MQYSTAQLGRVFTVRLEDGDILHESVEALARKENIQAAAVIAVGGADDGSRLVVGPEQDRANPVAPMEHALNHTHELAGVGTLFPDEEGNPVLHMHAACGRNAATVTGCVRAGVRVWHILEVVIIELTQSSAVRVFDPTTGFKLMQVR